MRIVLKFQIKLDSVVDMVKRFPEMLNQEPMYVVHADIDGGSIEFSTKEEFYEFLKEQIKSVELPK